MTTTRVLKRNPSGPGLAEVDVTSGGAVTTADVGVPGQIGGSPYTTLKDFLQNTRSAGRISGGVVSSHGDGTADITQMDGMIFTVDAITGLYIPFRKAASNISGITDLKSNYLYIDYDNGNLTYRATTDRSIIHEYDQFTVGRVFRRGTIIEPMQTGHNIYNKDRRAHDRLILKYGPMDYVSGAQVTQPASLKVRVEAGSWYCANYPYTTAVMDSSGAGTFKSIYISGASTWTYSAAIQTIDTLYYNNTNSPYGLVALANNSYGVYWVGLDPNSDIYLLYGQAQYAKHTDAEAATVPTAASVLPPEMQSWGRFIAKIVFQKGASSFLEILPLIGSSSGYIVSSGVSIQTVRRQVAFGIRSSSAD
jgi:hypothetical protein